MKHIGAKDVVDVKYIRQVAKYLYDKVKRTKDTHSSSIYDIHNIRTIYTGLMIMWSTLHRGTSNPLPFITNYNGCYEYILISDKDYSDEFNSKYVYLPKKCQDQLKLYIKNTQGLIDTLKYDNKNLFNEIQGWGQRSILSQNREKRRQLDNSYTFFIIENESSIKRLEPKIILSSIKDVWPLDLHNIRKSVGSLLSRRECPDTIINMILGHYHLGTEPSGEYSSVIPDVFKRIAAPFLDGVVKDIGWGVI